MKILYITTLPITYNTSANLRNIALIKGFKSLGHEVHVLNIEVSEDSIGYDSTLDKEINCPIYYVEANKLYSSMSTKQHSIKGSRPKASTAIKNSLRKLYYSIKITDSLAASVKNLKKTKIPDISFDFIVSSSDFRSSHLLAKEFIKLYPDNYNKWIQYWGDPLTLDINNKNILPKMFIRRYEKKILSLADKIIYVSPITLNKQKELFPKISSKMSFIPIAYIRNGEVKVKKRDNVLKIGYFGDYFSDSRNLKPLYNSIDDLNLNLVIAGNSNITFNNKKNLNILNRQPYHKIIDFENDCDILICVCNKEGTQIPGKIYHYAATTKKILIITEKDSESLKEYLFKYDSYGKYIFSTNNEESIRETLIKYIDRLDTVYAPPLESFNARNIANIFIEEVKKINI